MNYITKKILLPVVDKFISNGVLENVELIKNEISKTEEEIQRSQIEKLRSLILYSKRNSGYYKNVLPDENTIINDDPTGIIKSIPLLTKSMIKENEDGLLTQNKNKLLKNASSGSTGFRTEVYWSKREQSINRATQLLWWQWAGYQIGDPILQTGITPNRRVFKRLKDYIFNTYYLQAFSHSESEIKDALDWCNSQDAKVFLAGYASSLYALTEFAGEMTTFHSAVSWGDKLFDHYRVSIKEKFNCSVFETYGSAEGLMIGAQKDLDYMYLMSPNVYLEILDDHGSPVADGQLGNIYVTNLNALSMPLIRYRIGDLGILLPREKYPNSRALNLPLIQKIIGRDSDVVRTAGGKILVVHSFTGYFEHVDAIKQFQIVQRDLSGFVVRYISSKKFNDIEIEKMRFELMELFGEKLIIEFEEVSSIPNSPSGKPQLIVHQNN
jgi:phenylacetate-CoA ligase